MKNYDSLFSKIEECAEEFNKNLRYNEFEKSLAVLAVERNLKVATFIVMFY